jgi:hypothetical protein
MGLVTVRVTVKALIADCSGLKARGVVAATLRAFVFKFSRIIWWLWPYSWILFSKFLHTTLPIIVALPK